MVAGGARNRLKTSENSLPGARLQLGEGQPTGVGAPTAARRVPTAAPGCSGRRCGFRSRRLLTAVHRFESHVTRFCA